MIQELKNKIQRRNKIVEFYQNGFLSEAEFKEAMKTEDWIDKLNEKIMEIPEHDCHNSPEDGCQACQDWQEMTLEDKRNFVEKY